MRVKYVVLLCVGLLLLSSYVVSYFGFVTPVHTTVVISPDDNAALYNALSKAQHEILVSVYIFTNKELAQLLVDKAAHNVTVMVLLDGKVKFNEPMAVFLVEHNVTVRLVRSFSHFHAKYVVIDGKVVIVGSHNWSYNAFFKNREVSVVVEDKVLAQRLRALFFEDFAKGDGVMLPPGFEPGSSE